jgi:hypothetical protein
MLTAPNLEMGYLQDLPSIATENDTKTVWSKILLQFPWSW